MICWLASLVIHQIFGAANRKELLFFDGRCGDVIENKAPLWKTWG
jgi:hypothetical protein